jgi:TRAP-type C4-dicarboxylate transport system permease small subunit
MLDRLLGYAGQASRLAVWLGGALLIFAAGLTTFDVFMRKIVNWSLGGADEIAGYLFAISTALAYAFTMLHRANVRIDALYLVLPRQVRLCLDLFGFVLLGGFLTLITERAHDVWWNSFLNSSVSITPLVTPLALPQGFWFFGMVFFMVVFILVVLRVIQAIVQRDWMKISELIGARSLDEEIAEELALAEAERARARELTDRDGGN